jgi:uroporphyrinogen decarboxylase
MPQGISPDDYFQYDVCSMSIDCSPRYEQKILEKNEGWYTYQDRWGYTATKKLGACSSVHFFDHKTSDPAAWEASKHRWALDKNVPARIDTASYFEHFDPYPTWARAGELYRQGYATNRYMLFACYGPWEATWRHQGYQSLLMNLALEPEWVADMAQTHINLLLAVLRHSLELGMRPDGFFMVEDLAGTRGLLFSPGMWRKILKPGVVQLGAFLKQHKIDFWMHCCGNAEALFPELIECGVQVMNPLQVAAGLNVVALRKKYGKQLAYYGNISAPMMSGPLDALEAEISSKVPLAKEGGYVYHSDHSIPPDVSLERYNWILQTVRKYGS